MKRSSGSRKTASNLSESVHQQLNMYALAAGAAGVSVVALAQPVEAKIVYTKANVTIGRRGVRSYTLDLNNDGITDFVLLEKAHRGVCGSHYAAVYSFFEIPTVGNRVEGTPPTPLSSGARIGQGQGFYTGQGSLATYRGDWRISSRIDNRLSRNSICTIVVMVLRSVCPRNNLAPRLGATFAPSGRNAKFWQ